MAEENRKGSLPLKRATKDHEIRMPIRPRFMLPADAGRDDERDERVVQRGRHQRERREEFVEAVPSTLHRGVRQLPNPGLGGPVPGASLLKPSQTEQATGVAIEGPGRDLLFQRSQRPEVTATVNQDGAVNGGHRCSLPTSAPFR